MVTHLGTRLGRGLGTTIPSNSAGPLRIAASGGIVAEGFTNPTITRTESRYIARTRGAVKNARLLFGRYGLVGAGVVTECANAFEVTCGIETPGGPTTPGRFSGVSSIVSVRGGPMLFMSDPIMDLAANSYYYVRSGARVTLGNVAPMGFARRNPAYSAEEQNIWTNGGASQVFATGAMSESGAYSNATAFCPIALIGEVGDQVAVLAVGDSIARNNDDICMAGTADSMGIRGWIARGLYAANRVPYAHSDRAGNAVQNALPSNAIPQYDLAAFATHIIICLGSNSMGIWTTAQARQMLDAYRAGGRQVYWCRVPPRTTGSWADLASQVVSPAFESARTTFHAWQDSMFSTGMLAGIIDPLSVIQSGVDPQKWIGDTTSDGIHPGKTGFTPGFDAVQIAMAPFVESVAIGW